MSDFINRIKRFFRRFFAPSYVKPTVEDVVADKDPSWLKIALQEVGVKELAGKLHNERILEYHSHTSYKATTDEVSWCSSFACFCMEKAGLLSTKSASARSWLKWGYRLTEPVRGCVVIFWRGSRSSWKGHVAFFIREDADYVYVLGGNQSDEVNISKYKKSKVLGYRWVNQDFT